MELFKSYMNDCFIFWSLKLNFENFKKYLNNKHPSIKVWNEMKVKILIPHEDNSVETDLYYKPTKLTTTYHTIVQTLITPNNNIPYNLGKRIINFVSNLEKVIIRLELIKTVFKDCKYPEHVISRIIFNAKL